MKKMILYVACILIVSSVAATPDSKIVRRFNETFPNAKNIKWSDDAAGYFVSFDQNGNFNKVFYNKGGDFVYSLKYFNGSELPVNITMALSKKFGETKVLGVTEVTTQSGTVYNIKLSKEEKLCCLNMLTDGTIVKEEDYIIDKH